MERKDLIELVDELLEDNSPSNKKYCILYVEEFCDYYESLFNRMEELLNQVESEEDVIAECIQISEEGSRKLW